MQLIPTCHILGALRTQQTEIIFLFVFSFFLDNKCGQKKRYASSATGGYLMADGLMLV